MAVVINGSGTVTGLAVGGLPDGTVDAGTLATDSVTSAKITDGTIVNADVNDVAASKLTGALPAISGANLTGLSSGLSEADGWYLNTQFGLSSNATYDFTNFSSQGNTLGTAMTESSGVFTFPSTGYWLVSFQMAFRNASSERYWYAYIKKSTNSGSSYSDVISNATNSLASGSNVYGHVNIHRVVDVTDTSTHRIKFSVFAGSGTSGHYVNSGLGTSATFTKLGDT